MREQQLISAHVLSAVRAAEARWGLASVRHWYQRFAPSNKGTPPRRHKITDRHARKVAARWIGMCRAYDPNKFYSGNYALRLD